MLNKIYCTISPAAFYDTTIHSEWPANAVEISVSTRNTLLAGLSAGKRLIIGAGGQPQLADPLPLSEPELKRLYTDVVQDWLDSQARQWGYDDIRSAVTYADEPSVPKYQIEGRAFRLWRSQCWSVCHSVLEHVTSGTQAIPTPQELIAQLPILELDHG